MVFLCICIHSASHSGFPALVVSFSTRASQPLWSLSPLGLPSPCGLSLHSGPPLSDVGTRSTRAFQPLWFLSPLGLPSPGGLFLHSGFPALVVSLSTRASQPLWFLSPLEVPIWRFPALVVSLSTRASQPLWFLSPPGFPQNYAFQSKLSFHNSQFPIIFLGNIISKNVLLNHRENIGDRFHVDSSKLSLKSATGNTNKVDLEKSLEHRMSPK
jgi:hypothetical protein